MSDLIVIIGPPASGKAAVGLSLSQLTGFRFFRNHMTAEPVAALFGWGTQLYGEVAAELRLSLFSKALAQPGASPIIFTFVWGFDIRDDNRFMAQLVELFESKRRRVFFVELLAGVEARIAREGTPLRLSLKPSKHNVEFAKSLHIGLDSQYRMNSNNDFPYPTRHLIVDTEKQSPSESAALICERFGFAHASS
jgi:hypothetical protein